MLNNCCDTVLYLKEQKKYSKCSWKWSREKPCAGFICKQSQGLTIVLKGNRDGGCIRKVGRAKFRVLHGKEADLHRAEQQAWRRGRQHGQLAVHQPQASRDPFWTQLFFPSLSRKEWHLRGWHLPAQGEQATAVTNIVSEDEGGREGGRRSLAIIFKWTPSNYVMNNL